MSRKPPPAGKSPRHFERSEQASCLSRYLMGGDLRIATPKAHSRHFDRNTPIISSTSLVISSVARNLLFRCPKPDVRSPISINPNYVLLPVFAHFAFSQKKLPRGRAVSRQQEKGRAAITTIKNPRADDSDSSAHPLRFFPCRAWRRTQWLPR